MLRYHYKLSYNKSRYQIEYYIDDYIDSKRVFSVDEFGRRLARDFESYSQFKDMPGSRDPDDLPLVQSNRRMWEAAFSLCLMVVCVMEMS